MRNKKTYSDDFTDDVSRWLPDEGWHGVEVIVMEKGISQANNPKFTINFASAIDPTNGFQQDLTNIPGKRWLLRQLLEACGIEPEINEERRKIYNWDISDVEGKTVSARIVHDKTPFIDRDGNERIVPKAKIMEFKKLRVK